MAASVYEVAGLPEPNNVGRALETRDSANSRQSEVDRNVGYRDSDWPLSSNCNVACAS